ncbi:MAG TPA: hypothetical protein VF826_15510 [Chloroflexia bacterium]|jgi:disulfide bond formation protein DsbB
MATEPDAPNEEIIAQFMLAEVNRLEARRETANGLVNQRFNFYLTITAAAIALITGKDFSNLTTSTTMANAALLKATAFSVLIALLGIGIMIFMRAVKADIEKKRLTEGVRWIKQFFITEMGASKASHYLLLPATAEEDIQTKNRLTSLPAAIAVVNSVLISTLAVFLWQALGRQSDSPAFPWRELALPFVTLLLSFMVHMIYMHWKYDKGDRKLNDARLTPKQPTPPKAASQ